MKEQCGKTCWCPVDGDCPTDLKTGLPMCEVVAPMTFLEQALQVAGRLEEERPSESRSRNGASIIRNLVAEVRRLREWQAAVRAFYPSKV